MKDVVDELREILADPELTISNEFLERLLDYIENLEKNQK